MLVTGVASAQLLNGGATTGVLVTPVGNQFIQGVYSPTFNTPLLTYGTTQTVSGVTFTATGSAQISTAPVGNQTGVFIHAATSLEAENIDDIVSNLRFAINVGGGFTDEFTVQGTPGLSAVVQLTAFGEGVVTGSSDAGAFGIGAANVHAYLYDVDPFGASSTNCFDNVFAGDTFGACSAFGVIHFDANGVATFQTGIGLAPFSEAQFYPSSGGILEPGLTTSASVNFLSTAGISALQFYDLLGNPLDLEYSTASGVQYGPLSTVAEPGTLALLSIAIAALGIGRRYKLV